VLSNQPVRSNFSADWAFGIQGAIENIIREKFPSQLRQWPLLQTFNFEAYRVGTDHFVIILRDKLSGTPAGPGELNPFPYTDHPLPPRSTEDVEHWLSYLINRTSLRDEDVAMVLPIHDSGQQSASADYEMFSVYEKELWNFQLGFWITRQQSAVGLRVDTAPAQPAQAVYNISGTNVRVNINSLDSSVNVVHQTPPEVFQQLLAAVQGTRASPALVATMAAAVEAMQQDYGTERFFDRYKSFMAILADHMQVFGPVVAPYLPVLSQLLSPS
jgi:hypothetical protein